MAVQETVTRLLAAAKDIGYGRIPPLENFEGVTIGAFDLILFSSDSSRNFDLLEALCSRYQEVKNDNRHLDGYLYVVESLARASGTTELPEGMRDIVQENPAQASSLKQWYRIT